MKRTSLHGLINKAGHSFEDVARGLDVSVSTVEEWALWKSVPDVDSCFKLAEFLQVDLKDIYLAILVP